MAAVKKITCYLFMGAPGVGKGTFAKLMKRKSNVSELSIGEVVREEISKKSEYGEFFSGFVKKGELIPDTLINEIVRDRLNQSNNDIILDGYPRNVDQARYLDSNFESTLDIKAVNIMLNKDIAIEKIMNRMVCKTCKAGFNSANFVNDGYDMPALLPNPCTCVLGPSKCNPVMEKREDDDREVIAKRFEEYDMKTAPLIDYYEKKGKLLNFQVKKGVKDIDELIALITA